MNIFSNFYSCGNFFFESSRGFSLGVFEELIIECLILIKNEYKRHEGDDMAE